MPKDAPPQDEKKPVNRREFLTLAWLASLGFFTINMAGVTFLFALPRFEEGEFGGVIPMGKVSDLPEAGSAPVNYPKYKIWLSNTDQGVMALYKVCTHLGCLYNWRDLEDKFVCPCHGSQFTASGDYIQGPAPRSLDRFAMQIVDENGQVLAESSDGAPVAVPDAPTATIRVDTGKRVPGAAHS